MTTLPGEKAVSILREIRRNPRDLSPYEHDVVIKTVEEIQALWKEAQAVSQEHSAEERGTPFVAANIVTHVSLAQREKRCILAYLMHRLGLIQELRNELGTVVLPTKVRQLMSNQELAFFESFQRIRNSYMDAVNVDLTKSDVPPKSLLVQVRVLKDFGEIVTEDGVINLVQGTTQYLKRADVEDLIRQGIVDLVD